MKTTKLTALLIASCLSLVASHANAALFTNSFGSLVPGYSSNDDSSWGAFGLGFDINFFGTAYNQIYLNNNGLVTFGGATSAYASSPINVQSTRPMITAFWTDLDTRNNPNADAGVYLSQTSTQTVITWNKMGYFSSNYSGYATFQVVLNDSSAIPTGQGDIGFFYGSMSSGTDTHNASAGFGDGLSAVNADELSWDTGRSSDVTSRLNDTSVWFNLNNGTPIVTPSNVPEPSGLALLGLGLAGIAFSRKKST